MKGALAVAWLALAACLEPATQLQLTGNTPGKAKFDHCSPLSCTGCCAGDVCYGGNTDEACGYDGRGCNTCPETHRCQSPGACYPLPVADTARSLRISHDPPPCVPIEGMMRCP